MGDRDLLPFRVNCEGYLIDSNGRILAKDSGNGFIMFPGGGVDDKENIITTMSREAKEETGMIPESLVKIGSLKILWGPNWAKTDKQKIRYNKFRGDEMHFFVGRVLGEEEISEEEDAWNGEKFMEIEKVVEVIESARPFEESVKEYREAQLSFLKDIKIKEGVLW